MVKPWFSGSEQIFCINSKGVCEWWFICWFTTTMLHECHCFWELKVMRECEISPSFSVTTSPDHRRFLGGRVLSEYEISSSFATGSCTKTVNERCRSTGWDFSSSLLYDTCIHEHMSLNDKCLCHSRDQILANVNLSIHLHTFVVANEIIGFCPRQHCLFLEVSIAFDYLFGSYLGIHCLFNWFEKILGAWSPDLTLSLFFLAEIDIVSTAAGETSASTPNKVKETEASTLCWETEASTMGRFWETKASTKWMDGDGETKASTHVFLVACGKLVEVPTVATPLGVLIKT